MEPIEYFDRTIYRWTVGSSTFLAAPEDGARLMNWNIGMADGSIRDVLHWPELNELDNFAKVRGGNPILFPFCARSFHKGKMGYWNWEKEQRPMPNHGFARQSKFKLEDLEARGFTALLEPNEESNLAYPYKFQFHVIYKFLELSLAVELRLTNLDTQPIPWAAGHHFYFQLPWNEMATRSDYQINIPAKKAFYHSEDGRLVPVKNFENLNSFDNPDIVDRIHTGLKENKIRFGPKNGEEDITIRIGSSPVPAAHTALVTWTENNESPFYCVEPWMAPPNAPEHKNGLTYVDPGETSIFEVEVSLI